MWDLCCDHGELGFYAYKSHRHPEVFFVDQVKEIVEQLQQRFALYAGQNANAERSVEVTVQACVNLSLNSNLNFTKVQFLAQRAQDLQVPLRGTVVLAGVGATTILKILSGLNSRGLLHAERLLLVPQKNPRALLDELKLSLSNYHLQQTLKIEEGERIRSIFVFAKN